MILFWIGGAVLAGILASKRNRDVGGWVVLSLVASPLVCLILLALGKKEGDKASLDWKTVDWSGKTERKPRYRYVAPGSPADKAYVSIESTFSKWMSKSLDSPSLWNVFVGFLVVTSPIIALVIVVILLNLGADGKSPAPVRAETAPAVQAGTYQPLMPGSDAEKEAVRRAVYNETGCDPSLRYMQFTGSDKTGSIWTVGCGDWLYLPTVYPQGKIKVGQHITKWNGR